MRRRLLSPPCCFTAALLLLYCYFTAAFLLLSCCGTAALLDYLGRRDGHEALAELCLLQLALENVDAPRRERERMLSCVLAAPVIKARQICECLKLDISSSSSEIAVPAARQQCIHS